MRKRPEAGEFYRHFKGNLYQIQGVAKHSETGEEMVVYQALYGDYGWYVRPLAMFLEPVDKGKYPDAKQAWRFEKTVPGAETQEEKKVPVRRQVEIEIPDLKVQAPARPVEAAPAAEDGGVAPVLLQFLDAETPAEKIEILNQFGVPGEGEDHKIRTLYGMAASVDMEAGGKSVEDLFYDLKNFLAIRGKYEKPRR